MTEKVRKALWGNPNKPLVIGDIKIPCYVLEDGTRVLSGRGMQSALALGQSHGALLRRFVDNVAIKEFINNKLAMGLSSPIRFTRPGRGGITAIGYEATLLVDVCEAVLKAQDKGSLHTPNQLAVAKQCEILTRGLARVGIIALVDEVTGYDKVRDRESLQKILEKYIRKDLAEWAKRFPDEFYEHMFRLKGWQWRGMKVNRPSVVGHYTNDLIYERLAPGVLPELQRLNPPDDTGRRKHRHHQWLTDDIGHPALAKHMVGIVALMRASENWDKLMRLVKRAFPRSGDQTDLDFDE
jgi:P63C domain